MHVCVLFSHFHWRQTGLLEDEAASETALAGDAVVPHTYINQVRQVVDVVFENRGI